MFGSYHGHHDYVMVSIGALDYGKIGPRDDYASLPYGGGIPQSSIDMTIPVPFNDIENMTARIERMVEQGNPPACVIMEPAMMNLGVVLPEPGFLEGVRALTKKHGIVLIFDEVKVGICTARGGAVERWGVLPDMVCLGKAIAGGTPCGAIGGSEEIMAKVNDGTVFQVGTYSGNPLSMAAARASFEQVMTDEAYAHLNHLNDRIIEKCDAVCKKYDFPGYTVGISSKGCVNFALGKITDYESFIKEQDADLVALAWLYNINRGLIIAPGREEEWTLSVTHTDADVDLFVSAFEDLVRDVTA
jgi:glutamate-1-semialdehyde 2,1-aminomutase